MSQAGLNNANNISPPPGSVTDVKGNDGVTVAPDGSGIINVQGETLYTTRGDAGAHTLYIDPKVNAYPITPYVVGPVGAAGYQTIQSAINAASAGGGGVVYIQPGTYTENLTLLTNVDLYGTTAVSQNQGTSTTIIGQHTPPSSGHVGFNSIYFQNTSHIFNSNAAGTTHIVFLNCESAVQSGYFLNLPNWTGIFEFWDNNPSAAGAPFAVNDGGINNSGGATLFAFDCGIGFGTNVMALSGVVFGTGINFSCPINFGTGSNITMDDCQFAGQVTFSGNATGNLNTSRFSGGTSPAITMSSSAAIQVASSVIQSTNNPAISGAGAGTFTYTDLSFINNAAFAGTLTLSTTSWQPYARAIAASDGTKVGTCAFNNNHFAVDANGFVKLAGNGQAIDSVGTQTGTNPITPTAAGLVTINGAVVAAGTNPLRTNGTGANTMALEVQTSQALAATDATKIGLCNFNSNQFAVDANGFTTLTNSSSTKPAFLAVLASTVSNVTGDGTNYTVVFDTEVFDQNNNFNGTTTFTAPVNGVYFFTAQLLLGGLTASFTGMNVAITTTARNYLGAQCNPGVQRDGASNQMTASVTCLANMTAGQTATLNISVSGSTKTISLPTGGATDPRNYFAGYLVA